jgi:hypothetical protein
VWEFALDEDVIEWALSRGGVVSREREGRREGEDAQGSDGSGGVWR